MSSRIKKTFARARAEQRSVLGIFATAGDPDRDKSAAILQAIARGGADFIEIGMPFSDPMADGPSIQAASLRALRSGMNLQGTLDMAAAVRDEFPDLPIILMGYYNPIYIYGNEAFLAAAAAAGADGLIIVDLPVEEDGELARPARQAGLDFIRLVTPTTRGERLEKVLAEASGFVYYVAVAGITGTKSAAADAIAEAVSAIRAVTDLPVVTGFGIRTPQQAAAAGAAGDGVVVGSALVDRIAESAEKGKQAEQIAGETEAFVASLAAALRQSG